MTHEFSQLIIERLEREKEILKGNFAGSGRDPINTRYVVIDNLLPRQIALEIFDAFPSPESMRKMSSFRERKWTSKDFGKFAPILQDISDSFHDPQVVKLIGEITGIKDQLPDPSYYAGGLSMMGQGDFLNPHLDNSHDRGRNLYRTLNLLYYVTPDWAPENGGNLELWDKKVKTFREIPSIFNRLVLIATNRYSWHSVNQVKASCYRCCVSNYYFSPQNPNQEEETFHVTSFNGRPNEPFRRTLSRLDTALRNAVRKIVRNGLGKHDIFHRK